MRRQILFRLLLCLSFVGSPCPSNADEVLYVSLIQLLANPQQYHGKLVRVEGFLHHKFEDHALYLSKSDADYLSAANAVWVSFADNLQLQPHDDPSNKKKAKLSYFHRKHVLIEGRFDMNGHGHLSAFPGEIKEVRRVLELHQWYK